MTVYFIRHWKVENNKNRVVNGSEDDQNLSEEWLQELETKSFVENMKSLDIDIIYTSALKRWIQTWTKINQIIEKDIPLVYDQLLNEQSLWEFAGRAHDDITRENNLTKEELSKFYRTQNKKWESWEQFVSRVKSFFDYIKDVDENILVVSHGWVYRAYLYHYCDYWLDESLAKKYQLENLEFIRIF